MAHLPREYILRRLSEGANQVALAKEVRDKYNIPCSQSSISRIKLTADRPMPPPKRSPHIPWQLDPEHRHDHQAQMLRAYTRREKGLPLREETAQALESWLTTREETDSVVHYEPGLGFFYVPRRHGIDTGLVRVPDEED